MGNQQDTNCFSSKLYQRKFHSDFIHKSKKQKDFVAKKNERIPERPRSSHQSQSFIESPNMKDSSQLSKNSKTISIQITINLKQNQQYNIDCISTKKPIRAQIQKTLASSLQSFDDLREDNSSYWKGYSTKSNTIATPAKKKIISKALSKSQKDQEFDKLSLPSESNFSYE